MFVLSHIDIDLYVGMHVPGIGHVASHASDLVYRSAGLAQLSLSCPVLFTEMSSPSGHQTSLEETMSEGIRMASARPPWMTQHRPKPASAVIRSSPLKSLPHPKKMRWSQAAPEIELTPPPASPTTAMTQAVPPAAEATTQVVPQAGEPKTFHLG